MLLSDVCLSCTSGKSRTERPRKTKLGTEVAHVTHDSDTTFKVKRSMSLNHSVRNFGTAACHLANTSNNNDCTHFYLYLLGGSNLQKLS